jgi:ABC-type cobalamin/Fe3+-siderophores transport system ATPase subunit
MKTREIEITLKNYRCFPDTSPAKITLRDGFTSFVGVNNAGKSSLLKFFYEFRPIFQSLAPYSGTLLEVLQGRFAAYNPVATVFDQAELFSNTNTRDMEIEIKLPQVEGTSSDADCPIANRILLTLRRPTNTWTARLFASNHAFPNASGSFGGAGGLLFANSRAVADLSQLFDAFEQISTALYIGPFRNAVNVGSNDSYFDIQVGTGFITSWKIYKAGNVKAQNEACHKLTEDIKRIFGFDDLDISSSADDRSLQVLINGRSFKLPEVGSGLTQFILVLATAAIKPPSYILIDEPELNLHPSLQLDFLTTLASYASKGILFATHSIGLARVAADRIYSVKKLEPGVSTVREFESTPHLAEFLGELSFSSYKELGFEKILLVEGRTEVKTFQQFLRLLKKDHEVVLIPLGGAGMINANSEAELMELTRISTKISAVIDSERSSASDPLSANSQGFVEACKKAKIDCKLLDWRAIENYFSERAIKKVQGPTYQALTPFQKRETLSPMWPKTENWRIAREMTLDELRATDLGRFLEKL